MRAPECRFAWRLLGGYTGDVLGAVEQVYEIALARPRGLAARSHPHFIEATQKITDLFLSKGVLRGSEEHG